MMKTITGKALATISIVCLMSAPAWARVTAEEAAKLKTTLTPMGAERTGNADGSIPAWTGGNTTMPPSFKEGDIDRPVPYADEKSLFVITAATADKYKDKLPIGAMELFKRYPDTFHIDVYPSHRTDAAPQWVYDNTFKNATTAETDNGGLTLKGAYGGIPFPIPKDGFEAMWNHLLSWQGGEATRSPGAGYVMPGDTPTWVGWFDGFYQRPYYFKDGNAQNFDGTSVWFRVIGLSPASQYGFQLLTRTPVDQYNQSQDSWAYFVGQHRTRKISNATYDSPNFFVSGVTNFDEFQVFGGAMDRYTMKLLGKKEMYVVYNSNKWWAASAEEQLKPHHANPDLLRWELHRVWVVEATLAPGKRNVLPHRLIYLDEDSWKAVAADEWDANGDYWHFLLSVPVNLPDFPMTCTFTTISYDLHTGIYAVPGDVVRDLRVPWRVIDRQPATFFTPDALAQEARR